MEPARFDEMRRGCWDIEARVADMDLDGVWASLCFPSLIAGFAGTMFAAEQGPRARPRLRCGRGTTGTSRSGPAPIPTASSRCRSVAARSRGRGGRGPRQRRRAASGRVSFPENPVDLGLPSMHTDHWDPFLRACEETGTVVCLHNGSASWTARRARPARRSSCYTTLFPVQRDGHRGRLAVGAASRLRFPALDDRVLRRRHRLGADAPSTASTT